MNRVAQVLAALEALTLIAVGALESFFFRSPELYPIFLIESDEYDAVALWTRNVGVYNMLMGLSPLSTSFEEVHHGIAATRDTLRAVLTERAGLA